VTRWCRLWLGVSAFLVAGTLATCGGGGVSYDLTRHDEHSVKRAMPESSGFRDSLSELLFPHLAEDDTVYAPGFTERAFRTVQPGYSQAQVLTLLGKPLGLRDYDGYTYWYYSQHGRRSKSFFLRLIGFDSSHHVVATEHAFLLE
jgi:hypothetical protein